MSLNPTRWSENIDVAELRQRYHAQICQQIIRIGENEAEGYLPTFSDDRSVLSRSYASGVINRIGCARNFDGISRQSISRYFEISTKEFIEAALCGIQHLRSEQWRYSVGEALSEFARYEHLEGIAKIFENDSMHGPASGQAFIVKPDIAVSKEPLSNEEFIQSGILAENPTLYTGLTPLCADNFKPEPLPDLHAVISCKWTIRTDRTQNTRTEILNLIRNRKGHLPNIVAVTAEPRPSRIAALVLGTGDLDCVYHFALTELLEVAHEIGTDEGRELLKMMVDGRRLRDISDLPFDLVM